jgi:hypothetical protein
MKLVNASYQPRCACVVDIIHVIVYTRVMAPKALIDKLPYISFETSHPSGAPCFAGTFCRDVLH